MLAISSPLFLSLGLGPDIFFRWREVAKLLRWFGGGNKQLGVLTSIINFLLGQWLNFELFGSTYLVGKIKFKLLFQGPLAKSDLVECVYHMNWWNTKIWAISLLTTIVFLYLRISNLSPALEDDFRLQNGHFPLQWLLGKESQQCFAGFWQIPSDGKPYVSTEFLMT